MELNTALENRRSIRRFKDVPVSDAAVAQLVQAAMYAPSWKNSQSARYYIAEGTVNDALLAALPDFNRRSSSNARLVVVTFVKGLSGYAGDAPCTSLGDGFSCFDCGLSVQNFCLKATELGLGTLIMGIYDEFAVRTALAIPEDQLVMCVLAVGVPDIEPTMPKRLPIEEILIKK